MTDFKNVLFLCPHGAAKSVLARCYFDSQAAQADLQIRTDNAGTEPDAIVPARVVDHLRTQGRDVSEWVPRKLTAADLERADVIVSIGSLTAAEVPTQAIFVDWSDVPMLSDGFEAADDQIKVRAEALVRSPTA
jgi:protein-tyrosine-phosphatase